MKFALVSEYLPPKNVPISGGVEARTLSLAKQLARNHEVHDRDYPRHTTKHYQDVPFHSEFWDLANNIVEVLV